MVSWERVNDRSEQRKQHKGKQRINRVNIATDAQKRNFAPQDLDRTAVEASHRG